MEVHRRRGHHLRGSSRSVWSGRWPDRLRKIIAAQPGSWSARTGAGLRSHQRPAAGAVNRDRGYMFLVEALLRWKTMPNDGPTNVLGTLETTDSQTDWSKVDLSRTFTNPFVESVK
jgi:hypothetical protein